jgi:hypothetical protein
VLRVRRLCLDLVNLLGVTAVQQTM